MERYRSVLVAHETVKMDGCRLREGANHALLVSDMLMMMQQQVPALGYAAGSSVGLAPVRREGPAGRTMQVCT